MSPCDKNYQGHELWQAGLQVCHGPGCEVAGRHSTQPHLSKEMKAFIQQALLQDLPHSTIQKRAAEYGYQLYMLANKLDTVGDAHAQVKVQFLLRSSVSMLEMRNLCLALHQKLLMHSATLLQEELSKPRDIFVTDKDIDNEAAKLEQAEWKYDPEQAKSVRMFTESYPDNILLYQEISLLPGNDFHSLLSPCAKVWPAGFF